MKRNPPSSGYDSDIQQARNLLQRGQPAQAAKILQAILAQQGNHFDGLRLMGVVHHFSGDLGKAAVFFEKALDVNPCSAQTHHNLGVVQQAMHQPENAAASFGKALEHEPKSADSLVGLGEALTVLGDTEAAVANLRAAAEIDPTLVEAHNNLGIALTQSGKDEEAVACLRKAVELAPDLIAAHLNLGRALKGAGHLDEALASYRDAVGVDPAHGGARFMAYALARQICNWAASEDLSKGLIDLGDDAEPAFNPFVMLSFSDDAETLHRFAERFVQQMPGGVPEPSFNHAPEQEERIRIAYVSSDFHQHATAFLMAELFELHDRDAFEIYAISYGRDDGSEMRQRLVDAFDTFLDVRDMSDAAAAALIAANRIHIAVDLKGHTEGSRSGILRSRPAPIQVNYLGYPGTMGADFIDYALVDPFIVPLEQQPYYTEKLVQLPHCYQVNDSTRRIAETTPSRADCGLPDEGFVFCCFNNNYKILPKVFDAWARLLVAVEDSVLWLLADNEYAVTNLKHEAEKRGIGPERLVFAPRMSLPDHLARHRLAGLFLDTLPYNAHTTASDALWAGLPVVTCPGNSFASRVAGSLLQAIELPELIAGNLDAYEDLALKCANDRDYLAGIRTKLEHNRASAPLFDTDRFRIDIEAAYREMYEIWALGETPCAFKVEATSP